MVTKYRRPLALLILLGVAAGVLVACGGGGGTTSDDSALEAAKQETERAEAQGLLDKLPVQWQPGSLTFSMNPGGRQQVPVTLTTTKALKNARIVFLPDLRDAVTISPSTIPSLAAGQSATVTLTFAPAATDTRKLIAGVVLLFDKNATVSRPLPVRVSLEKQDSTNAVVWAPAPLAQSLVAGDTKSVTLTLTATRDLPSLIFDVAPELAPYAKLSPASLPSLSRGQVTQVTVTLSAKRESLPMAINGVIQARTASSGLAVGNPLTVALEVTWLPLSLPGGIALAVPPTLESSVDPLTGVLSLAPPRTASLPPSDVSTGMSVYVEANPRGLSLTDFYDGNPGDRLGTALATIRVGGREGLLYQPPNTLGGDIVVIVPLSNGSFLRVNDRGEAFQANGVFDAILKSIRVGV